MKTEGEEGVNLHLHLLKRLEGDGIEKYFSVSFGAEMIVTNEKHYGAMVTLAIHPWRDLILSVSPRLFFLLPSRLCKRGLKYKQIFPINNYGKIPKLLDM